MLNKAKLLQKHAELPGETQLLCHGKSFVAPVAAPAVKHNVVVVFLRSLHVVPLLKLLWGQLQGLVHHGHWNCPTQREMKRDAPEKHGNSRDDTYVAR